MSNDGLLLEDLDNKFDAVVEVVVQMRDEMKTLAKQEDLEEVKADIKVIKAAVTDLNLRMSSHDTEIAELKSRLV